MNKTKKLYFMLMLISVFLVSTLCFSYAFFTSKTEGNGKLNIVAGTLDYKIESTDLKSNQITVGANEIKEIKIKLYSLNDIDSKYELYYTLDNSNDNVRVGYDIDTKDSVLGTIDANSSKTITIVVRNESDTDTTINFDVIGGLANNDLTLSNGNSLNQVVGKYDNYAIGEEITLIDGSKWHVLETSSETDENIVLLSDYNLNSDGTYNDECGRDINNQLTCSSMDYDTNLPGIYDETDSANIAYFIKNTYAPLVNNSLSGVSNITIPTAEQIAIADGQMLDNSILTLSNSWLSTTHYWTKTNYNTSTVWVVNSQLYVLSYTSDIVNNVYGVRPTITTPKSNIVETMSSNTELSIGTAVEAVDGSKWHVLEASNSDSKSVTLLSDYNLNSDGTYNTECGRDVNSTYGCSLMAFDPDNTVEYDESDSNNIGYFIKNTYAPLVNDALLGTTNITLPTAYQIGSADNQTFNDTSTLTLSSSWLITTSYWTKTYYPSSTSSYYVTNGSPQLRYWTNPKSASAGARPVITTLKTNLLAK